MSTIGMAERLARIAHGAQKDKAGKPYALHYQAVAELVRGRGPNAVMAALLHDTVEDTHLTLEDLEFFGFPPEVVSAVDSVTQRQDEDYFDMVRRAAADPIGRLIKLADNAHNSDERRLALLPRNDQRRLRRKYTRARTILNLGADPAVVDGGDERA